MANFAFTEATRAAMEAEIDFGLPDDFRVLLVMSNTTADTEADVTTISGFATLDELDDTGYARQQLGGTEGVTKDNANNLSFYDADDVTFTYNGDGTRDTQAAVVLKHVTDDTDSVPLSFVDTGGFPVSSGQTGSVTLQWAATGIIQLTSPAAP